MNYHLLWKNGKVYGSGRVQTWNGKVVDTTPALKWLVGRPIDRMLDSAEQLGARVILQEGKRTHVLRPLGTYVEWHR